MRTAAALLVAVVALTLAADDKASPPKSPLADARTRLLKGNYAEARAAYEKHLADPKLGPAAAIGVSRAWRAEGEYQKAIDALSDALKAFPDQPDVRAARGDVYFDTGRWEEAAADADAALKKAAGHFAARWVRARLLRDGGKLEDADKEVRWFVREYTNASNADRDIKDADTLLLVGQAGAENARWNNLPKQFGFVLREIYGDTLKYDPDCWWAEYLAGSMLLEKFNRPQALDAFDAALKINPNAAEPFVGKGKAALQKFEAKDAEQFADQALKINPKLVPALHLKADVQFMGGNLRAAEQTLLVARGVNPRDAVTLGKLAGVYLMLKRQPEFDGLVQTIEAFDARPAAFYHELAEYLDDRKLYSKAEAYFRKAADLRPKLAASLTSLGMLYLRLAKEEEGRKILDQAFKADPFNVRVANSRKVMDHLGKYAVIKTAHYDVKYNPETDKLLAEFVAEYAEEVHADLKKQFRYEPTDRVPLEVFSRHDMFSGRTVGLPDLHTIGACTGKVVAMASPKAVGVAKPFSWGRVLRHELVHIFNLAQTDFQCPHWLTEGLAVRNEQMARPFGWLATLRDRFEADDLLTLDTVLMAFVRPRSPDEWQLAYCQSQLYVEYLVKAHGEEAVAKLLVAYRDGLDTGDALKTAIGVEKEAFEKGYRAHVEQLLKPYRTRKKADAPEKPLTFEELEAAHKKSPDDVELTARYAAQLARRDRANEARKLVDAVLEAKPGHPAASIVKARLLQRAGEEEAVRAVLEAAIAAAPDDPRVLIAVGRFYVEAKEFDKAAVVLEKGRTAAPLDGDWLEQLARLYTETKQTDKLIAVLKEVVAHDPDELAGRIKLAKACLEAKQNADAETFAWQAARIDVTNADAQATLLAALKANGKDDAAARLAKRFE